MQKRRNIVEITSMNKEIKKKKEKKKAYLAFPFFLVLKFLVYTECNFNPILI